MAQPGRLSRFRASLAGPLHPPSARLVESRTMVTVKISPRRGARRVFKACGVSLALVSLALCAYAGGQARRPGAAKQTGVSLTAVKARAKSGRAAKSGPSANVGQEIRLVGSGFDENVSVQFTAFANSTFIVRPLKVKNRRVEIAVPAEVITGAVKLIDPESGSSNTMTLQVVPTVTTVTPATVAPGGRLLIDGAGFTRDATVIFKGVEAPVAPTIVSPSRIDIVVPAGAKSGRITVVTPGGRSKPVKLEIGA